MDIPAQIRVLVVSLTAPVLLYTINQISWLQDPQILLAVGITVITTVLLLTKLNVKNTPTADHLYYVFAVFSFTSVVGITNSLQQDGYIKGFMDFYVSKAEPYLSSAHCIMIGYWDGVVHFGLLLIIVHQMSSGNSFRSLALFWAGSTVANQIVLIAGIILGKYGKNFQSALWRNAPFLVLSIWAAAILLNRPRELSIIPADKVEAQQKKGLLSRPVDLLLTLTLIGSVMFTVFRGFVVLECSLDWCFSYIYQYEPYMKDNVGFPKVTMLVFLFYALPLLTACVYGLLTPGCVWMLDWTLVLAGAMAQTQWAHIGASIHSRTPFTYRVPKDEWRLVMTLNLLYAAAPVLLAIRCYMDQVFFMKTVPPGQTSNGKKME